ncbi:IPT/TIG domain-containing protein [Phocaeicola paurosaccharolyticus]|uniref:IPT/TIG domain-containing protein n=1 Tax=Phocaeicola paurosaccharolyticus TaxID=732242 RepID=UPI002FDF12F9
MKMTIYRKKSWWGYWSYLMLAFVTMFIFSCKDKDDSDEEAFDPQKEVVITDFTPKEGGYGSNLILYGENFGNDKSKIKVKIGGKEANIINVKNNCLYCVVPSKAYSGVIEISVNDENGNELAYAEANGTFEYTKKWLVTTLVGQKYQIPSDEIEKEGPFDDCGCFKNMVWFSFDPKSDFDIMYVAAHSNPPNRKIDFANEQVYFFKTPNLSRPAIINWTADENADMVISDDIGSDNKTGNWLFSRSSGFTESTALNVLKSVNGAMIHPVNGELYYAGYYTQDVARYDFATKEITLPFRHNKTKETVRMVVHPTGKYAYITQTYYSGNGRFISRSDYNEEAKTFTTPYLVCGSNSSSGYVDGVGDKARLNKPGQGVFVKNPNYSGEDDEYDYYFCDTENHAIRVLTPQGRVYTFAGRGNMNSGSDAGSGYTDGELRTEARFTSPMAIAYDEKRNCFYIGDTGNKVIRKIAKEE